METKKPAANDPNVPTRLEAKSDPPPKPLKWEDNDVQVLEDDGDVD
jgi:hypothetical protein